MHEILGRPPFVVRERLEAITVLLGVLKKVV